MTFQGKLSAFYRGEVDLFRLARSADDEAELASQEFATAVLYDIALSLDSFFDTVSRELDIRREDERGREHAHQT
jgi:hypothetical protein